MNGIKMLVFTISALILTSLPLEALPVLPIGSQAPDFSLRDTQGDIHSLASLKGHKVALIFYPKPNTPGCTKEVCNLQDRSAELENAGITVLSISQSSPEKMKRFKEKYHISFPLLMATDEVLQKYHTKGDISTLFMPKRYTFLIDEQGRIVSVITNVDLAHHAHQIIKEFEKSKKSGNHAKHH